MYSDSVNIAAGDWYFDTDVKERAAVVTVQDWGYPVAIFQYEDGRSWDQALTRTGDLPGERFELLPTRRGDAPVLADACDDAEHVFNDVDSSTSWQHDARCGDCRLSVPVLVNFAADDLNVFSEHLPGICTECGETLPHGVAKNAVNGAFYCESCSVDSLSLDIK